MRVSTDTTRYWRSHGTAPRGKGLWYFELLVPMEKGVLHLERHAEGTLTSAKNKVVKEFKLDYPEVNWIVVVVLP